MNCASFQDSQPCQVLFTLLTSVLVSSCNFVMHFSNQCTYSIKGHTTMGLFTRICVLAIKRCCKHFLMMQKSNYTMEVCLMLYELFVSKIGPKYNCLVDFFAISLLIMHAHMLAYLFVFY